MIDRDNDPILNDPFLRDLSRFGAGAMLFFAVLLVIVVFA